MAASSSGAHRPRAPKIPRTEPAPRESLARQPSALPLPIPAPAPPENPPPACSLPSAFRPRGRRNTRSRMRTQKRLAAHSSSPALPPVRASSRSCSSTVALFFELSSARPQLMRPPGSQPHRHPRPRRPILPSPDSTPQQTLLSLPRRPQFVVGPIGKQYAHPAPARSPARSPPTPTNPLPESSSFSTARTKDHLTARYATRSERSSNRNLHILAR